MFVFIIVCLVILIAAMLFTLLILEHNRVVEHDLIAAELEKSRSRCQDYQKENQLLSKYKGLLSIEQKTSELLQEQESTIRNAKDRYRVQEGKLKDLEHKIDNAHKEYKFRKALPETYKNLDERYKELKNKFDQCKSENKTARLDSKEREKFLAQFTELGKRFIEDTYNFSVSKMTPDNFTASRDRVLKAIELCQRVGFDWADRITEMYHNRLREEFRKKLRIDELRKEQQRIKAEIKEELEKTREIEALKKQQQEAIKKQEETERQRAEMKAAITDALLKVNGEHTVQILEMERALAEKDKEIAEKQKEIEDNQRAIPNAQLTKAGHVYVLSNIGSFGDGIFKIGMTRRDDPDDRVKELSGAPVPFPFDVHLMVSADNAPELEHYLHKKFTANRVNRVNMRKEFFKVEIDEVCSAIKTFLNKDDIDYIVDPHIFEEYAEQYRQSAITSLADIEEVEKMMEEYGFDMEEEEIDMEEEF